MPTGQVGLEVAAGSVASAIAAQAGGAMRVELCGNLASGGITASSGTLAIARDRLHIPLYGLIRPRSGDFVFDAREVEIMCKDIEHCFRLGCDGIATGALTVNDDIDRGVMRTLMAAAGSMGVTFHRAFDLTRDAAEALEDVIALGCERVLTSGGRTTAIEGAKSIAQLVQQAKDRVIIMPGAGITESNLLRLRTITGAREFHASAQGRARSRTSAITAQISGLCSEYKQTDPERVRIMISLLKPEKT